MGSKAPPRRGAARLREALRDAMARWLIATLAVAALALAGDAGDAGARDDAPSTAPSPAPSPRGDAAAFTALGFDAEAGWSATPRRMVARPRVNPRRAAEAAGAVGVASFSAETPAPAAAEEVAETPAPGEAAEVAETPTPDAAETPEPERSERIVAAIPSSEPAERTRPLTGGAGADDALPQSPRSGSVGYVVVRLDDQEIVAALNPDEAFIPASVAKVPTALYALDTLGADFQFRTRLIATGPVDGGVLHGDLVLVGGGDPTLDSADLDDLVEALKAAGIDRVAGRFLYDDRALPHAPEIEPGQPVYASYNPGVSGLSLNFNRVLMKWERRSAGVYDIEMRAHAAGRWAPATSYEGALLPTDDRALFRRSAREASDGSRSRGREIQVWSVASRSLGRRGQRWLPVQDPSRYAADAFRRIAEEEGVVLPEPEPGAAPRLGSEPDGARVIAEHLSKPLRDILRGMLKYSTNITAEAVGLTTTGVRRLSGAGFGAPGSDPSRSLRGSGEAMAAWVNEEFGLVGDDAGAPTIFYNHSGLTAASRVTPRAMAQILVNASSHAEAFEVFYGLMPRRTGRGARNTAIVRAKTGTIYYGRALAGYIECRGDGARYAFAYFNSDPAERAAFDLVVDVHAPAAPRSATVWLNRAVSVERALMARWTRRLCG